jgi:hypothetical protein
MNLIELIAKLQRILESNPEFGTNCVWCVPRDEFDLFTPSVVSINYYGDGTASIDLKEENDD